MLPDLRARQGQAHPLPQLRHTPAPSLARLPAPEASVNENPTLAWARHYQASGLHPIPCHGKKAAVKWEPFKERQPTVAEIEKWFIRPGANIALVLGRGLIAVDLDGPGAEEHLAEAGVTLPPDAPRSRTSEDGCHVFLRVAGPVENRVKMLASTEKRPGSDKPLWQVDIRADGGYVVAPPSIHPDRGTEYTWERRIGADIPAAPPELLALIRSRPAAPAGGDQPKWVSQALQGVGHGQRDDVCTKLAGYFLGKGHPPDVVLTVLKSFADRCQPPFPHDQVEKTVASVARRDNAAREAAEASERDEFQILGHDHGSYYYLPRGSRQVVELRAEQHTKLHLLRLAPLKHWEEAYQGRKGPEWDLAANALIRRSEAAGVYDPDRVRGRGAWWDPDRQTCVLHVGDALIVGDARSAVASVPGARHIYEAAPPIPVETEDPLPIDDANEIVDILSMCSWENSVSARLAAGWAVVAPVCGAMPWRPHVWITGGGGTGKSTILNNILRPLVGEIGLAVQSVTTEAGLRQRLGRDARPVTFDEIDAHDQRGQSRIQNVLELARQASSEGGAEIIKGSASGGANIYHIRSCFAFASIGVGVSQFADATRVTILGLVKGDDPAKYARLQARVATTINKRFSARWVARSIRLVPAIRANAETFAVAGAQHLGSRRLGDQIGVLLAGAYSLYDEGLVSPEEASAYVASQDWGETRAVGEATDEAACLQRILEHPVRVASHKGPVDRTVAELLRSAAGIPTAGEFVTLADSEDALGRVGIRVDVRTGDCSTFTVSASHSGVAALLEKTKWSNAWARTLKRLPGARATDGTVRFGATKSRGVEIPLEEVE